MADKGDPGVPGDPGRSKDTEKALADMLVRVLRAAMDTIRKDTGDAGGVATVPAGVAANAPPAIPPPVVVEEPKPTEPTFRSTPMSAQEIATWRASNKREQIESDIQERRAWTLQQNEQRQAEKDITRDTERRDIESTMRAAHVQNLENNDASKQELADALGIEPQVQPVPPKPAPVSPTKTLEPVSPTVFEPIEAPKSNPATEPANHPSTGSVVNAAEDATKMQIAFGTMLVGLLQDFSHQLACLSKDVQQIKSKSESRKRSGTA